METIEQVGAVLGIVAFLVLAVLALMYFQQAREVRRLRDWAGRAPERAAADAERQRELDAERAAAAGEILHTSALSRAGSALLGWSRRLPIDPLYLIAIAVGLVVALGVVTGGYGLLGGDGEGNGGGGKAEQGGGAKPAKATTVAVLNATQEEGVSAFSGVADAVAKEVKAAGYDVPAEFVTDSPEGFAETVAMYAPDRKQEAKALARDLEPSLGPVPVEPMSDVIAPEVGGVDVALVVGLDDASIAQEDGATTGEETTVPGATTVPEETLTP